MFQNSAEFAPFASQASGGARRGAPDSGCFPVSRAFFCPPTHPRNVSWGDTPQRPPTEGLRPSVLPLALRGAIGDHRESTSAVVEGSALVLCSSPSAVALSAAMSVSAKPAAAAAA